MIFPYKHPIQKRDSTNLLPVENHLYINQRNVNGTQPEWHAFIDVYLVYISLLLI